MKWSIGLLLVVLALGAWLVLDPGRARDEPVSRPATETADDAPDADLPVPSEPGAEAVPTGQSPRRLPLSQPSDTVHGAGTLVDPLGKPVEGAVVSWSPLAPPRNGPPPPWQETDWRKLAEATLVTGSDAAGAFAFTDAPPSTAESAVWVTHPRHVARYVLVPEGDDRTTRWRITLDEAPPRRAVVLGEAEAPIENAVVRQFAGPVDGADGEARRAREVFYREWRTDETGEVEIATFPGDEGLVASHGGHVSPPLTRPCSGDVTLRLFPSFQALGAVVLTDGGAIEDGVRVFYGAHTGGDDPERLGAVTVADDGNWGPVAVALAGANEYLFSVEGGGVVRKAVPISRPLPEEEVRVDIETTLGVDQWFGVFDAESGEPLAEASVEVHWQEADGSWTRTEFHAREDGYLQARGCRPGTVWLMIRCPGYAFERGGPEVLPTAEPQTFVYRLDRAGGVRGTCLVAGQPATDFEVLYWPGERTGQLWNEKFVDREDGSFTLEDVPAGDLSLIAHGAGYGQSELVRAEVPVGGEVEVVLELSRAGSAHGIVVDQVNGEPVADASVQLFATSGVRPVYETGSPVRTDRKGRFRMEGLSQVPATAVITAQGYGLRNVTATASDGASVDLGRIALSPAQPLEIRLHAPAGADPTHYTVRTRAKGLPATPFSPEGIVFVEEFTVDAAQFEVALPSGEILVQPVTFLPGEDWVVDILLDGSSRLDLEILPEEEGGALPPRLYVQVRYPHDAGAVDRGVILADEHSFTFDHLAPGRAHVDVSDDRCTLVCEPVELVAGESTNLRVRLDQDVYRFRVVDADGRPLPSTRVRFLVDGSEDASLGGTSDSNGELLSAGLGEGVVTAVLSSPHAGTAAGVPVELGPDPDEVVLLPLVAEESLAVRLVDDNGPAFGLTCRLFAPGSPYALEPGQPSDSSGIVRWTSIGEGEYGVFADHVAYWPLRVTCHTSDSVQEFRVRRRSALRLRARTRDGASMPGVAVSLESVDLEANVADWVEAGLVRTPSGTMVTDAQGHLEVDGLPCGDYLWRVHAAGTEPFGGRTVVPCDEAGEVLATFP